MKIILLLAFVATFATAQQAAPAPPPPLSTNEVIRIVEVKNATASTIRYNLSQLFSGITEANGRLVVRGPAAVVDMIEEAIKKLDVAPPPSPEARPMPNVELTVQLLQGLASEGPNGPIPPDLEGTVKQLRSLFSYKGYKLLDTQLIRVRNGADARSNGTLPGGFSAFDFRTNASVNTGPAPRSIRLARLNLNLRQQAANGQYYESTISGEFDAKEGQKTVVGKANVVNTEDAIFLVIAPKIIE